MPGQPVEIPQRANLARNPAAGPVKKADVNQPFLVAEPCRVDTLVDLILFGLAAVAWAVPECAIT
jgi:hypothetical protein